MLSTHIYVYGPEAYLMHLTDLCQFLNCSVRMGGGGGGGALLLIYKQNFFLGGGGGGNFY
jgi:hypothetical protein